MSDTPNAPPVSVAYPRYAARCALRALRPLRALKRISGMPVLINSLLAALPRLGDVAMLVSLLTLILGITATEEYKGALHYRCAAPGFREAPSHPSLLAEYTSQGQRRQLRTAGQRRQLRTAGPIAVAHGYDTAVWCDPHAAVDACPALTGVSGSSCSYFEANMFYGVTTFDSFGWSVVIILQALTFDAWTLPMYGLLSGTPVEGQTLLKVLSLSHRCEGSDPLLRSSLAP